MNASDDCSTLHTGQHLIVGGDNGEGRAGTAATPLRLVRVGLRSFVLDRRLASLSGALRVCREECSDISMQTSSATMRAEGT